MPTITEQYTEFVNQTQAAALTAVETWTKTMKDAFATVPGAYAPVDLSETIDQTYDFAVKALQTQRDYAKTVISTSTEAAETVKASMTEAAQYGVHTA